MRIWTVHPHYLDSQGLVALWRETLLAQKVLSGQSKGYRHHPQLLRFREQADPVAAIAAYLHGIHQEATRRGYHFDARRIVPAGPALVIVETSGQLLYEWQHLLQKLSQRAPQQHALLRAVPHPLPHPLFQVVEGEVRPWERVRTPQV
jgi:hypothetical protein